MLALLKADSTALLGASSSPTQEIMSKLLNMQEFQNNSMALMADPYPRHVAPDVIQMVLWLHPGKYSWDDLADGKAAGLLSGLGHKGAIAQITPARHRSIPLVPHCHVYMPTGIAGDGGLGNSMADAIHARGGDLAPTHKSKSERGYIHEPWSETCRLAEEEYQSGQDEAHAALHQRGQFSCLCCSETFEMSDAAACTFIDDILRRGEVHSSWSAHPASQHNSSDTRRQYSTNDVRHPDHPKNMNKTESDTANAVLTDEQAALELRLAHQRLGHTALLQLRELHKGGELLLPDLSADQFDCVQFFCKTCALTRSTKKPHASHRRLPPEKLQVLSKVYIDVAGPRKIASLVYTGDRGNQAAGGNYYTVFYLDAATERVFPDFINHKDDLEASVVSMRAHLEMEARKSVDFKGEPILIQTIVSDGDSNLTSNEAVADMIRARIKHIKTAADTKQQTPLLDNVMRRVQDITSSLLHAANLPFSYWELAETVAAAIVNAMPTERHKLHHSAMRRWEGKVQDLNLIRTFGAEAFVHVDKEQREHGDKLSPKSLGGGRTVPVGGA